MEYEDLLKIADSENLITKEKDLQASKGRIKNNRIAIKKGMTTSQKACVLAEELGHYYTTAGDILDQTITSNRKQEHRARIVAYEIMIGLNGFIKSYKHGCHNLNEMADYLDVTEHFLMDAIEYYKNKYGICVLKENYIIYFEPNIGVFEKIK